MMQVTEAAFQAKVSLNEQTTDPKSHTSVRTLILYPLLSCHLQYSMVDSHAESYLEETRDEHGYTPTSSVAEGEQRLKKEQW